MQNRDSLPPETTDEVLVSLVAQSNKAAFSLLYDRYARAVYVMSAHMLGSAEAEEFVQDVFMRLWNKAGQFDPARGSFAAWFMTSVRNHLKDLLRGRSDQSRLQAVEDISHLFAETADPHADVEEEAWKRERGEIMQHALRSLPEEQRLAVFLAYFGGFSQSAIAERLALPLGTVKKRIRLGLQKMRVLLNGKGLTVEPQEEHTEANES